MQITTFKYFENYFNDAADSAVKAGNQNTSTILRLVLQIKVSSNFIMDTNLVDAKATLENTHGTSAFFYLGTLTCPSIPLQKESSLYLHRINSNTLKDTSLFLMTTLKITLSTSDLSFSKDYSLPGEFE